MVIVKLIGGLGNQLFQYAAGRQLAHVLNTTLKLDITGYEANRLRTYSLSHFHITAKIANRGEIASVQPEPRNLFVAVLNSLRSRLAPYRQSTVICEEVVGPVRLDLLNAIGDVYLDGYWQSEKYFNDIQGIIRREFQIKDQPDDINRRLADQISSVNAVSLHVRRGDYVTNPVTSKLHNTCGLDYYHKCVNEITARVEKPHYFIFSDDPAWVRRNLRLPYPVVWVDHNNSSNGFEDLRLMNLCRHHIIANSSFSWWGAWLSNNPEKTICAPLRWFNDSSSDTRDLIPEKWIRL